MSFRVYLLVQFEEMRDIGSSLELNEVCIDLEPSSAFIVV